MKPWEINPAIPQERSEPQQRFQGETVELVESEYGEHERTRPGEGYTPPGEGRPQGHTVDSRPIDYRVRTAQETYGDGVFPEEDLYAPPPPEPPSAGKAPMLPQEYEAVWHQRALERQAREARGKTSPIINTEAFMKPAAKPAMHQLALHERELDRKNSKDEVIVQLEAQIKQRQAELARDEVARSSWELRVLRSNGATTFVLIRGSDIQVIGKIEACNFLGGILS